MSGPDFYAVLGVDPGADTATIRSAARRLKRELHPDRTQLLTSTQQAASVQRFREVATAVAVLGDPEQRAAYDRLRSGAPFYAWLDTILRRPVRGEDVTAALQLDPMTSVRGGVEKFNGRDVRVPAGAGDGDTLRIAGAGGAGSPPGDLLLEVRVMRTPGALIWREGDDLHVRLAVTWHEALRRGRFRLRTPWEEVETELPASVAGGGAELSVEGHGARPRTRPRGQFVAHVELVPPPLDMLVMLALEGTQGGAHPRHELEALLGAPAPETDWNR